jgi:NAD(P)-dependent dehydrogenase (short-subunit alcohol dehydrogenase family)
LDVFRHAKKTYGHVDLVFANAGIGGAMGAFEDKLDENGELAEPDLLVIDVNLKSVILSKSS